MYDLPIIELLNTLQGHPYLSSIRACVANHLAIMSEARLESLINVKHVTGQAE